MLQAQEASHDGDRRVCATCQNPNATWSAYKLDGAKPSGAQDLGETLSHKLLNTPEPIKKASALLLHFARFVAWVCSGTLHVVPPRQRQILP